MQEMNIISPSSIYLEFKQNLSKNKVFRWVGGYRTFCVFFWLFSWGIPYWVLYNYKKIGLSEVRCVALFVFISAVILSIHSILYGVKKDFLRMRANDALIVLNGIFEYHKFKLNEKSAYFLLDKYLDYDLSVVGFRRKFIKKAGNTFSLLVGSIFGSIFAYLFSESGIEVMSKVDEPDQAILLLLFVASVIYIFVGLIFSLIMLMQFNEEFFELAVNGYLFVNSLTFDNEN